MNKAKPFAISKKLVWQAYKKVKANEGAPGVDAESVAEFEMKLKDNLYRIWNRLSSGTYFPPPVKAVEIPKKQGGIRVLGVPTVSDRIAQTAIAFVLNEKLEPIFDEDSYGYRPDKSAHQAVAKVRQRCWRNDWVVEFDIKGMFDNIDHDKLMKAVKHHIEEPWVILYVQRWLKAPMLNVDGELVPRTKGTPQGGVVSPILANLFMHYGFDAWMRREFPNISFCRYADDGLLHCRSEKQAECLLKRLIVRFKEVGLEVHPDKTRIVYCKDENRKEEKEAIKFDFLGFTFRPRRCVNKKGVVHPNFLPAVSSASKRAMNRKMRSWHIQLKNNVELLDLSKMFNKVLTGWYNYYGKFYPSGLGTIWRSFNSYLVMWVRRKYKCYANHKRRARAFLRYQAECNPKLFIHWKLGCLP